MAEARAVVIAPSAAWPGALPPRNARRRGRDDVLCYGRSALTVRISIVNAHILFMLKPQAAFVAGVGSGDIPPNLVRKHELDYTAGEFRLEGAKHLLPGPAKSKKPRIRTTYKKKITAVYFSKYHKFVAAQAEVERGPGGDSESHRRLIRIAKRRECIVCRFDFRNGKQGRRKRPKLTQLECPE